MTLTTIFRIIKRDAVSLVTNMTGLSFGLATAILLTVFIRFELSFDRYFSNSERIVRLNTVWVEEGQSSIMPICLRNAYSEIPEDVGGIEASVQIFRGGRPEISFGESRFSDYSLLYSDPEFLQIFDLEIIEGDATSSLDGVNEVVLTKGLSQLIFGDQAALGKEIELMGKLYQVSAVIEDVPANTHFQFDFLLPMKAIPYLEELGGLEFFTYYLLEENTDIEHICEQINRSNSEILGETFKFFTAASFDSNTEMLEDLHMHTEASHDLSPKGNMKTIFIMLIIVVLVMLLALSNFINLCILSGVKRSKEIGLRKVNGAKRPQLVKQFYTETFIIVSASFILGIAIAQLLIPDFGRIMQRESFGFVLSSPVFYFMLFGIFVFTVLVSGFYPAVVLSGFKAIQLFSGKTNLASDKRFLLKIASVIQLTITMFLLCVLLGTQMQIKYLKNLSPGYNPENVVMLYNLNDNVLNHFPALQQRLEDLPGVSDVAASAHTIGGGCSGQGIRKYGDDPDQISSINEYRVQAGVCSLYQIELLTGRYFDPNRKSDTATLILNEAAVKMLGLDINDALGELLVMHSDPCEIIGITEDFYYNSAANVVEPLVITAYDNSIWNIPIRLAPSVDRKEVLDKIQQMIQEFDPEYVMINRDATELYKAYYRSEDRLVKIIGAGSILSLIIVIMGVYALASHNITSRTKEIGIRKVMGGSASEMLQLIYKSTLIWTLISAVIAVPVALLYLNNWLDNYLVKMPLHWWIFAISIAFVFILETLITLGHSWRVANKNPIDALRYE